jgi:transposase
MPFPPAPPLSLRDGDKEWLEAVVRRPGSDRQEALRAGIILLCAEGLSHRQIQRQLRTSIDTIARWRGRYEADGLDGLKDRPRSRRPALVPS